MSPILILSALLAAAPAAPHGRSASGRVVDAFGRPISHAEVCSLDRDERPVDCVPVDANGAYRIENTRKGPLLVRAKGFVSTWADAAHLTAAVALAPAAELVVKVVDDTTGKPVPSGQVTLFFPSGKRIGGAAPFNRAGVKISTLTPGDTLVKAEAEGYEVAGPVSVTVAGGESRELIVRMRRSPAR